VTHRRAIRTTNLLERLFVEERRRLKIIPNAFGERAVLKLMFGALIRAAERWRSIKVTEFDIGKSVPSEKNSIRNMRPKSVSKHNSQRMWPRRKYPAIFGLDRWVATAGVRSWSNSAFAIAPADAAGVEE
jgi:hypothetical protein